MSVQNLGMRGHMKGGLEGPMFANGFSSDCPVLI